MSRISMVVLGGLLALSAGCGLKPADQPEAKAAKAVGGVGVVDLDMVAKRLGRDIEMSNEVQERLTSLNNKLATLRDSLRRLYEEKQDRFGESPTEEQEKELQATRDRMDQQLLELKRKSEIELANYRQALVDQFREQAKPVLRDVAAARGLSIVIPKNNGLLLSIDPAVEITDEVATKMPASTKAESSEASPPPARTKSKKPAAETSAR
jgi:Skp family chaperone for outer membrane proteins